jgi:hypothetical protein
VLAHEQATAAAAESCFTSILQIPHTTPATEIAGAKGFATHSEGGGVGVGPGAGTGVGAGAGAGLAAGHNL